MGNLTGKERLNVYFSIREFYAKFVGLYRP
jgi:hypothetical protein